MARYSFNSHRCRTFRLSFFCLLLVLILWGCGGDTSSEQATNEQQATDPVSSASTDTGSASFAIQWHTGSVELASATESAMVRQAIGSCVEAGVESITCDVYDASGNRLAGGGPWDCSRHSASVDMIPVGSNRTFAVLGWSGADGTGDTVYQGQATVTINAGPNNAVTINARPFTPQLLSPGNGDSVAVNSGLTWNSVTNASRYHVLVSTDSTFATRTIDELTNDANPTYMPVGLTPATIYYWRVTALDAYGNEGAPPTAWSFTTTETTNELPTATISAPANNSSFTQGDTVNFSGSGQDPEDGTLTGGSLVWTSSRDGQIGTGASFGTQSLSVGTHTITLTVTDSDNASDTDSINITISSTPNQPPVATISAPANNSSFTQGDTVNFRGSGQDPEDGSLSGGSLVWTSSRDGRIGTGTSFGTSSLSVGTHTITLTVTDSDGAADTDSIRITVSAPPNQPPTANITAPSDGSTFTQGDLVTFRGTGQDPEDGTLSGGSLVWTSSISGRLGTGTSFQTQSLSVGNHTITLTVTDSDGAIDRDAIRIVITNVIDVNIDSDFDYVPEGFPMELPAGDTPGGAISEAAYENITSRPYDPDSYPLYSYLDLGNGRDNRISIVLYYYSAANYPHSLYIDKNNNEDLADDGAAYHNEVTGGFATTIDLDVDIELSGGVVIQRPYRLWLWLDNQNNPRFYALCHYRGQLVIGGRSYTAVAFEARNHDALYQESGLYIDLNADGSMNEETENFLDGELFTVNGTDYQMQLNYP
jgi:predicted secreted protein